MQLLFFTLTLIYVAYVVIASVWALKSRAVESPSKTILLVSSFLALYAVFFTPIQGVLGDGDYGHTLFNAERVLQGELPWRDFQNIYGPLELYFGALWFAIFGVHYYALVAGAAVAGFGVLTLLVILGRHFLGANETFLASAFTALWLTKYLTPWTYDPLYTSLFGLIAAYCIFESQRRGPVVLLMAGLAAGFSLLGKQELGFAIALAALMLVFYVTRSLKKTLVFAATATMVPLLYVTYLLASGASVDQLLFGFLPHQLDVLGVRSLGDFFVYFASLNWKGQLPIVLDVFVKFATIAVGVWVVWRFLRNRTPKNALAAFFAIVTLASLVTRSLSFYFLMGHAYFEWIFSTMAFGLSTLFPASGTRKNQFSLAMLIFIAFGFAVVAALVASAHIGNVKHSEALFDKPRLYGYASLDTVQLFTAASDFVSANTSNADAILCLPYCAQLNFITQRKTASYYYLLEPSYGVWRSVEKEARIIADLNRSNPPYVFIIDTGMPGIKIKQGGNETWRFGREYHRRVMDYVTQNYKLLEARCLASKRTAWPGLCQDGGTSFAVFARKLQ